MMGTRERKIESESCKIALEYGYHGHKLTGRNDPDRVFLHPKTPPIFVEFKAHGEEARPAQKEMHKRLRDLGFSVYVIDSIADARKLFSMQSILHNW